MHAKQATITPEDTKLPHYICTEKATCGSDNNNARLQHNKRMIAVKSDEEEDNQEEDRQEDDKDKIKQYPWCRT